MGTVPQKRSVAGNSNGNSKRRIERGVMNPVLAPYTFKPGQSGNPLGRPKNDNLAAHIRQELDGGKELCDRIIKRFREPDLAPREELEYATWLADRGFAKPKPIDEDGNPGQLGTTLVQVLVSLGPEVVREVNRRLIEASGGDVIDVERKPE